MRIKNKKAAEAFSQVTANAEHTEGFRLAPHPRLMEEGLYDTLRAEVPIIDAAICKLVRLSGGFQIECERERTTEEANRFFEHLPIGVSGGSLADFAEIYLDSLLTYGRAFGEIIVSGRTRDISSLYCADCTLYNVRRSDKGLEIYSVLTGDRLNCPNPERILYTAQNPSPKHPSGVSLLRGLPALSSILMRIYETVGQNFERAGNVRYAVTYKPSSENEAAYAKERAVEIARQWSDGMAAARCGTVKDFVAVGDVQIKVIGADGVVLDTEIPVRQILEQMVAKLSIPPFLLGLSWSSTERMSTQQADLLTSEIDAVRRTVTPAIEKLFGCEIKARGLDARASVEWANVSRQDEVELARAELYRMQAREISAEIDARSKS